MRRLLAALSFVVLLALPCAASAQASAADLDTARGLFREGVAAGEEGRWLAALALFQRAHALSARADVLLNVAAAESELGHLVAAAETYRRFQTEADAAMLRQHGPAVLSALAELAQRTPRLTVTVDPPGGTDMVVLDGQALAPTSLGAELSVDTGPHALVLLGGSSTLDTESITLAERERRAIVLTASTSVTSVGPRALVDEGEQTASPPRHSDDSTLAAVLGVIGGVLVVGAAITLGVVLTTPGDPPSYSGNVFPYSIDVQ